MSLRRKSGAAFLVCLAILITANLIPAFAQGEAALSAPENFTARAVPGEKVVLNWAKVKDGGVSGYNVYRVKSGSGDFAKLNSGVLNVTTYDDKTVKPGESYDYLVKAVNAGGLEGQASSKAGAPNMIMVEKAVIIHQGKVVKTAIPGDVIAFTVSYQNNGYGDAREATVIHAIPRGTTFMTGSAKISDSTKFTANYWSKNAKQWVENPPEDEADIGKVRWLFADSIPPAVKDPNGQVSFKVVINE